MWGRSEVWVLKKVSKKCLYSRFKNTRGKVVISVFRVRMWDKSEVRIYKRKQVRKREKRKKELDQESDHEKKKKKKKTHIRLRKR